MYQPLVPCPACERHVRAAEVRCPFCAESLPDDLARRAVPGATSRLGRAALAVFAVGLVGAACSGAPSESGGGGGGGSSSSGGRANDVGAPVPTYGAPVPPESVEVAPAPAPDDAAPDAGAPPPEAGSYAPAPAYGGAPPR